MCQEEELQDIGEYTTDWHVHYYIISTPAIQKKEKT